jgi:hypothetical protein
VYDDASNCSKEGRACSSRDPSSTVVEGVMIMIVVVSPLIVTVIIIIIIIIIIMSPLSKFAQAITFLTCIREVFSSNLGYPE